MPPIASPSPHTPTPSEASLARESTHKLASLAEAPDDRLHLQLTDPTGALLSEPVSLPAPAVHLLLDALSELAKGNAVELTPVPPHLTTQQAADLLGVSRPFLIKQIEEGRLPCLMVGTHRRILVSDLLAYKQQMTAARTKALDELAAEAQNLNLGY